MLNTIKLLRLPFSLLLLPVFLFAVSRGYAINPAHLALTFIVLHMLVYPASNGYNSYNDRDTGSIGGLESPPEATKALYYVTLAMDVAAVLISLLFINVLFCLCVLAYIAVSRLYSYRGIRLKKYPYTGFLVVFIFQGGFTYFMCLAGINDGAPAPDTGLLIAALAASFQIGAVYPLTQIYQHEADLQDGVTTMSYRLGYRGTFVFSAFNFIIAGIFYYLCFKADSARFVILQLFLLPTIGYFIYWFMKVWRDHRQANYRHTMRLNLLSALSMNACFTVLIFYK